MTKSEKVFSTYVVNCVFNIVFACTAVILNTVTNHAIRRTSSLPKPLKTLLLSLTMSDLGVGLLAQPLCITRLAMAFAEQTINNPIYDVIAIADVLVANLFCLASFFNVIALSADRFFAIYLHLKYQAYVTHSRVVAVVISVWAFSAFLSLISLWTPQSLVYLIFVFIKVACIIIATYLNYEIYRAVRRHAHQIQALQVLQGERGFEIANATRTRKFGVASVYVYLVFFVCYLPYICFLLATAVTSDGNSLLKEFQVYSVTMMFLNSSLNPVIYCWKVRHVRCTIANILRSLRFC